MAPVASLATTVKRNKARQVFGTVVSEEVQAVAGTDEQPSLCYSVSTTKSDGGNGGKALDEESSETSSKSSSHNSATSSHASGVSRGPFDKVLLSDEEHAVRYDVRDKENSIKDRSPVRRIKGGTTRSPLRRDLVKKTQDAIKAATISVSQSLHAGVHMTQPHKTQITARQQHVSTQEAQEFQHDTESQRRELLHLKSQLVSQNSREKARRRLAKEAQRLQSLEHEGQFQSAVFREQHAALKTEQDRERRLSIEARAKVRADHRKGRHRMQLQAIQEEEMILSERREASVAQWAHASDTAQQRRQSFQFRRGDARRIRQLQADMENEELARQHASYELNWQAQRDARDHLEHEAQRRRDSLAARGRALQDQRRREEVQAAEDGAAEHESYELKWQGDCDADAYKRQLAEERRQSLAGRNSDGVRQRKLEATQAQDTLAQESASYELKWQAGRDAAAYAKQQKDERRQSLENRNRYAKAQRDEEMQRRNEALNAAHASFALKIEGQRDAAAYHRRMEDERRQSLAARNKEAHQGRKMLAQQASDARNADSASLYLKWDGARDAAAHEARMREERRKSIEDRNRERARHNKVMEELQSIAQQHEKESLLLKWAGENDAQEYLQQLAEKRRVSLQHRSRQIVLERHVANEEHTRAIQQQHEDELLRANAQRDVQAYKEECAQRERTSLEYRRKEDRKQRIEAEKQRVDKQLQSQASFLLDAAAFKDMQDYLADCHRRRRMSLVGRAKETQKHRAWKRQQHETALEAQADEFAARLADQRSTQRALHEEQLQRALNDLQYPNF